MLLLLFFFDTLQLLFSSKFSTLTPCKDTFGTEWAVQSGAPHHPSPAKHLRIFVLLCPCPGFICFSSFYLLLGC